jgi:ABC-type lipoprotein release transport system permease subunit
MTTFRLAAKNVTRYKKKTRAIFLAVFLSVFLVEFFMGFLDGFSVNAVEQLLSGTGHIKIRHEDLEEKLDMMPIDLTVKDYQTVLKKIKSIPELSDAEVSANFSFGVTVIHDLTQFDDEGYMIGDGESYSVNMQCIAINPNDSEFYQKYIDHKTEGEFINGKRQVFISRVMKDLLKVKLHDNIQVLTPVKWDYYNEEKVDDFNYLAYEIVGFFDTGSKKENENIFFCDLFGAQELLMFEDPYAENSFHRATEIKILLPDYKKAGVVSELIKPYIKEFYIKKSYEDTIETIVELSLPNYKESKEMGFVLLKYQNKIQTKIADEEMENEFFSGENAKYKNNEKVKSIFDNMINLQKEEKRRIRYKNEILKIVRNSFTEYEEKLRNAKKIRPHLSGFIEWSITHKKYLKSESYFEFQANLMAMLEQMDTFVFIFVFIILLAALISITNIILVSMFERFRIFGTMRAIGLKKRQLIRLLIIEAGVVGSIASLLGIIFGGVLVLIFQKYGIYMGDFSDSVEFMTSNYIYTYFDPIVALQVMSFGIILSIVSTLYPALYVSKLEPIKALHYL